MANLQTCFFESLADSAGFEGFAEFEVAAW
jgi:hypothetical protein